MLHFTTCLIISIVGFDEVSFDQMLYNRRTRHLSGSALFAIVKQAFPQLRDFFILLSACRVLFHAFVGVCRLFSKLTFAKNYFRNPFSANQFGSRSGLTFCPDLGLNALQRLSAEDKIAFRKERVHRNFNLQPLLINNLSIKHDTNVMNF